MIFYSLMSFLHFFELILKRDHIFLQMLWKPYTDLVEQLSFQVVIVTVDLVYGLLPVFLQHVWVVFENSIGIVIFSLNYKGFTIALYSWFNSPKTFWTWLENDSSASLIETI